MFSRASSNNASSMRGLVTFIADLRNARARELEEKRINKELANIRDKFKDSKLDGYQKKKYVCKLLYIYILGWNVDFGHLEAVNLVSARKYSEKQIGYLAVTLFLHEQHDLLPLVVNSIRKDLLDHNELNNCLALHAIANVGGREMGEALGAEVHRLLISPTSKTFVKKKAALTLLRLYRKHPGIVQHEWADRIVSIMDDPDMGVGLSVTSLVVTLAQDDPERYKGSYVKAARRLKEIVVDGECSSDYHYYRVPCPWLQVKYLKLLRNYPPSEDTHVRDLIRQSLQKIMDTAMHDPKNVQQNNAQNAVLFEAINVIIHLDDEHELMVQISSRLARFIVSRETNVRYLGLEAMTHLAARSESLEPIKKHQNIIIGALRDRDISVRRQGLDLLYSMCDSSNAQPIVNELLKYVATADYAIREEMVLKIAILTEKYATDIQWYVDITLRLIAMAGDHVSDEVWQRVIMIVTNNEELQVYAAQHILNYLKAEQCHETLVKIGGYLLGEFGHLIADNKGCSPIEQLMALQSKLQGCPSSTKAIILSCFLKFVNLFPEIKPQLLQIFRAYSHTLDAELQQRACEYLALATLPTDDLLRTVCDEMPPFPERASALLSKIQSTHGAGTDKRTFSGSSRGPSAEVGSGMNRTNTNGTAIDSPAAAMTVAAIMNGSKSNNGTAASVTPQNGSHDLNGLDMASPAVTTSTSSAPGPSKALAARLSPGWEAGYNALLLKPEGILYEDSQVQVGLRTEYRGALGALILYITNKMPATLQSLTTSFDTTTVTAAGTGGLKIETKSFPESTLAPEQQTQQTITVACIGPFEDSPIVEVSYLAGSHQSITLMLPVVLHKYAEPATLSAEEFFKRWKQIGGPPREAQRVFGLKPRVKETGTGMSAETIRAVVRACGSSVLDEVDPNARNVVGACVLSFAGDGGAVGGKVGCLVRLEPNFETAMFRCTIRATDEAVPPLLMRVVEDRLSEGDGVGL